jgi:hypothetical protein
MCDSKFIYMRKLFYNKCVYYIIYMRRHTHANQIPVFLQKESSESIIPDEDNFHSKIQNVYSLKYKSVLYPKTKHKLDTTKYQKRMPRGLAIIDRRSAISYSIEHTPSSDSSIAQIYTSCHTKFKFLLKKDWKKRIYEMLESYKICETFLSYLSITDVLNFNYVFHTKASPYTFLLKKHTESSMSIVSTYSGIAVMREKVPMGVNHQIVAFLPTYRITRVIE